MKVPSSRVEAFLAAIEQFPHIERAAKAAGIARSTHYKREERDLDYAKRFARSWKIGCGRLRDKAIEFVHDGIPSPVIYKGQYARDEEGNIVFERKIPERLFMKVLGAEIPDVYNRNRVEHSGPNGGPIEKKITVEFVKPKDQKS